jgi:hypothetical protein
MKSIARIFDGISDGLLKRGWAPFENPSREQLDRPAALVEIGDLSGGASRSFLKGPGRVASAMGV